MGLDIDDTAVVSTYSIHTEYVNLSVKLKLKVNDLEADERKHTGQLFQSILYCLYISLIP